MSFLETVTPTFKQALCHDEFGFTDDGYLSPCFTNTYLFAPIAILLILWSIYDTGSLNTDGHAQNSTTSRIKFVLTCAYSMVLFVHGGEVFNIFGVLASFFTAATVFVLSFCDLKGVRVAEKPIEVYFFLVAAVTGYFVVHSIGTNSYDSRLLGSVYICLISSLAGSARNIISAFEDAQVEVKKPKSS